MPGEESIDKVQPGRNAILLQLSRILRSPLLRESEMLRNFLSFVVKETLNPEGIPLKQYSIALHAFNRAPDFDPVSDPIVRIQASRLRRIIDQYYREEGVTDIVIIDLPKGSYVPLFYFSNKKGQKISSGSDDLEGTNYSIAVKPLRNLTIGVNEQLITEGFTQEIIMELSRYSHIQVVRLADEEGQISDVATARFYLDGSMQFAGNLVKISIAVTDSFDNQLLSSYQNKVDIDNNDLIQIQEDVATAVARETSGVHGVICKKLYVESNWKDIRSTQAYVTFIHYHRYDKDPSRKLAIDLAERLKTLLQKEPLFAAGHAILANLYGDSFVFGLNEEDLEKAIFHSERAVELQPNNRMCQAYCGYSLMLANRTKEAAIHLDKAISINPHGNYFLGLIGWCYCMMGQLEKGHKMIMRSIGVDFQYPKWLHMGSFLYYLNRREYDKMLREVTKMGHLDNHWVPLLKLVAYNFLSLREEAKKQLKILYSMNPDFAHRPEEYIECVIKSKALSEQIYHAYKSISGTVSHHFSMSN